MPEATRYYFANDDSNEAQAVEKAFVTEFNDRSAAISRAWDYYDGNHDKPLKKQKDGYDDNVIINNVETLVERLTAFLIGEGIRFDSGGDSEEDQTDLDIKALWEMNRGKIVHEDLALSGAIEGHCAVRLMPDEEMGVKLIRLQQSHFSAFWDPFDMSRVMWYRLQHSSRRIDIVRGALSEDGKRVDPELEGWVEVAYERREKKSEGPLGGSTSRWAMIDEPVPWGFPWAPIVDWKNLPNPRGYYGKNDVASAIRLNDAYNFLMSNTQRIIKHFAAPKTAGTGFSADELVETVIGGFYTVPSPEAKIFNLEMQSDGALVRWMAENIITGLWQSGGMVDNQTVKDLVGQLTNFGLKVLFANAIKRTGKKRLLYEEALEKITKQALALVGAAVPERVRVVWPDVLPEDDRAEVETLTQELDRGIISKRTYRAERGYNDDIEEERLSEERDAGDLGAGILGLIGQNRSFNRGG